MRPGALIDDRFVIEALAGSGGVGAVYRAHDRQSEATVAVKVIPIGEPLLRERFRREARALEDLAHPAIVRYVAHGTTASGDGYLAMEWLDGEDLLARLRRAPLSVKDSVTLCLRAADALSVAHRRGLVHRDVKPGNLFLPGGDVARLKVLDFGLARARLLEHSVTASGMLVGTPSYMAPEQVRGERDLDARADVFSLGCVLYRCLTGQAPFGGEHVSAILAKILFEEPPSIGELRGDLPPAMVELVTRMLSKAREGRPLDAGAVFDALCRFAERPSLSVLGAPPPSRGALTIDERRLLTIVLTTPLAAPSPAADAGRSEQARAVALRTHAERFGGHFELLADGSAAISFVDGNAAVDQVVAAARCALSLQPLVPEVAIAVATGRDVLPTQGDVIDRAAAMLRGRGDDPSTIWLDQISAGLLDARFEVDWTGSGGEPLLRLCGEREASLSGRTLLGRAPPCVGRERELLTLKLTFDECAIEPVARVVLVTAHAGVGKTRLRDEFLRKVRARGAAAQIWLTRGDPLRAGATYGMLAPAIRDAAGILEGEPLPTRRHKLRARIAESVRMREDDVERVTMFVGEMISVPFDDARSPALRAARNDAMVMGDQVRRAFHELVAAECASTPLVIVLEDLHWGDLASVKLVDEALRVLHDRPLLVLALARPEVHQLFPGLFRERGVQELSLGELTKRASERLVRWALGDAVGEDTVEQVVTRSAGNALFLEELIRAATDLTKPAADSSSRSLSTPPTVVAMAQARLQRLDAESRRVLRAASVFGERFHPGGVLALLESTGRGGTGEEAASSRRAREELSARLASLCDEEVIERRAAARFPGEVEHAFRHALLRDAAYEMLTEDDRALGHRLAAAWLEAAGEGDAIVLAEHYERGGDPKRAVRFYRDAAAHALEASDFQAAIALARRGVACGAEGEELGGLAGVECEAHLWRSDVKAALAAGLVGVRERPIGSVDWYTVVSVTLLAAGDLGRRDVALDLGKQLYQRLEVDPPSPPQMIAWIAVLRWLLWAGHARTTQPFYRRLSESGALESSDPALRAWAHVAVFNRAILIDRDPWLALQCAAAALSGFESIADRRTASHALVWCGWAHLLLGDWERAESFLRRAIASADELGLASVASQARNFLGLSLAHLGRFEEAHAMHDASLEVLQAGQNAVRGASSHYRRSTTYFLQGEYVASERAATQAIERLSWSPTMCVYAYAKRSRALLAQAQGATDDVMRAASIDAALADALASRDAFENAGGACENEPLIQLVLAEALDAKGDREGAQSIVAVARRALLARAASIPDEAVRGRFLGIPEHQRTLTLARVWGLADAE